MTKLYNRQKVLLALLQKLGDDVTATNFQKHLFMYTRLCEQQKSYDFVPFRFGCYSFQATKDKKKLVELGYLETSDSWKFTCPKLNYLSALPKDADKKMTLYVEKYKDLNGKRLIKHVYKNYPFFAINSEILRETLSGENLKTVLKLKPKRKKKMLFATIGYEGLSIEKYLTTLITNDVRMLIDVRKNPISRKYGFSKNTLTQLLSHFSIAYRHISELGIDSVDRKSLKEQSDYDELFRKYERTVLKNQSEKLHEIINFLSTHRRIAITCFEETHTMCHRGKIADKIKIVLPEGVITTHL